MLNDYENELDPPTMTEFMLFLRLGNLLDAYDNPDAWSDIQLEEEIMEVADLVEQVAAKYDTLLLDWYEGTADGRQNPQT